jgi:hypothetical protein
VLLPLPSVCSPSTTRAWQSVKLLAELSAENALLIRIVDLFRGQRPKGCKVRPGCGTRRMARAAYSSASGRTHTCACSHAMRAYLASDACGAQGIIVAYKELINVLRTREEETAVATATAALRAVYEEARRAEEAASAPAAAPAPGGDAAVAPVAA